MKNIFEITYDVSSATFTFAQLNMDVDFYRMMLRTVQYCYRKLSMCTLSVYRQSVRPSVHL